MENQEQILPKRQSIRLYEYDYSLEGLYFVTICTQNRVCLFGEIINEKMVLNEMGKIAHEEWGKTPRLRKNIKIHEFIIMPNHMHGVIEIVDVGAYCIRPQTPTGVCNTPLQQEQDNRFQSPAQTLGAIIRGYKSAVTRQINELRGTRNIPIWQRNYYEHIIRNDESYQKITEYIYENPNNRQTDYYYQ